MNNASFKNNQTIESSQSSSILISYPAHGNPINRQRVDDDADDDAKASEILSLVVLGKDNCVG